MIAALGAPLLAPREIQVSATAYVGQDAMARLRWRRRIRNYVAFLAPVREDRVHLIHHRQACGHGANRAAAEPVYRDVRTRSRDLGHLQLGETVFYFPHPCSLGGVFAVGLVKLLVKG